MMKLQIVIMNFLRVFLIPTKLIIIKTISNLLNTQSQFSLEPFKGNPYLFTINLHNPQQILIKGSTMTFENGHSNDLKDPDLQYFITNTKFDREIKTKNIIYSFLNDMYYNIDYGDKKSIRYYFIEDLHIQNYQLGSGLPGYVRSSSQSYTNQYVFLPSEPDEIVDQLKLLYFEKNRRK